MQRIERVEKQGHQTDGRKGGGDFARHDSALAHTCDHQLGFAVSTAFQKGQSPFDLIGAESLSGC